MNEQTSMRYAFAKAFNDDQTSSPLRTLVSCALRRGVGSRERKQHWSVSRGKR